MQHLEAACLLAVVPVCALIGAVGSALTMRVVLHRSMRAHLINRCIFVLSAVDLLYLTAALANSALSGGSFGDYELDEDADENADVRGDGGGRRGGGEADTVRGASAAVLRRLLLPSLARASLLVIVIISAERFCAVRKPRHLQAGNSRKSLVYASLTVAAAPFVLYGLELATYTDQLRSPRRYYADPSAATTTTALRYGGNNATSTASTAAPGSAATAVAFAAADASLRGIPLAGILLLNLGIVRVLRQSFRQRERLLSGFLGIQRALLQPGRLPRNALKVLQRQRKTTCMLVYMSTFHLLLLTPAIFLSLLARLRAIRPDALAAFAPTSGPRELTGLIVALETVSCSFNFALYIRQSEKFRTVFLGLLAAASCGCCSARGDRRQG